MDIEKFIIKFVDFFDFEKNIIEREDGTPYLTRYYIFRKNKWWQPSIYIHCIHESDADLELHCHPWAKSVSFILSGSYLEERREEIDHPLIPSYAINKKIFSPGNINYIRSDDYHRLDLLTKKVWTLFISGPKTKDWYFWDRDTNEYTQWEEFEKKKRQMLHATK